MEYLAGFVASHHCPIDLVKRSVVSERQFRSAGEHHVMFNRPRNATRLCSIVSEVRDRDGCQVRGSYHVRWGSRRCSVSLRGVWNWNGPDSRAWALSIIQKRRQQMSPEKRRGFPVASDHVRRGADWLKSIKQISLVAGEYVWGCGCGAQSEHVVKSCSSQGVSQKKVSRPGTLNFARSDSIKSAATSASLTSALSQTLGRLYRSHFPAMPTSRPEETSRRVNPMGKTRMGVTERTKPSSGRGDKRERVSRVNLKKSATWRRRSILLKNRSLWMNREGSPGV